MEHLGSGVQIAVGFSRFVRYFVPGWFTAFWIMFYVTRYNNPQLESASELLSLFGARYFEIIPIVLALGGFIGVCLVGLDSVIHSFVASRTLNFIVKYMLSSRVFNRFPFISFMRIRYMKQTFDRWPSELVKSDEQCKAKLGHIVEGPHPSRCFLKETLQNHFWYDQIDKDMRLEMKQTSDVASMFFYISSISLLLLVLQLFLYFVHVVYVSHLLGVTSLGSLWRAINTLGLSSVDYTNAVPLALFAYVVVNLSTNAIMGLWRKSSGKKQSDYKTDPVDKSDEQSRFGRLEYYVIGFSLFIMYLGIIYFKIVGRITWFQFLDPLLIGIFFLLFVSGYWAGTFEYCRFFINYDRYFQAKRVPILAYAVRNSLFIEQTHDKVCGCLPKPEAVGSGVPDFSTCGHCGSVSSRTLKCVGCGSNYCAVCALNLNTCPKCGAYLTRRLKET